MRRSNREPWRGHSTVQVSCVELAVDELAVVVRAAVLDREELAGAVEDADLEVLPSTSLRSPGRQLVDGADVDHGPNQTSQVGIEV